MKKLYYLIFIILIVIILYSLFKSAFFYIDNKKIEVSFKETNSVSESFSNSDVILTYRNKYNNDDIIGILVIDGLNINELVVKGVDIIYGLSE